MCLVLGESVLILFVYAECRFFPFDAVSLRPCNGFSCVNSSEGSLLLLLLLFPFFLEEANEEIATMTKTRDQPH